MIFGFPDLERKHLQEALQIGRVVTLLSPIERFPVFTQTDVSGFDLQETIRASKFFDQESRKTYMLGRLLLRSLLGELLGSEKVDVTYGPHGKPYCTNVSAPYFNLSHGGKWIGLSLCSETEVGLDLESLERQLPYQKLAKRYFTETEYDRVLEEGKDAFMNIWVRKEACVKAQGKGITVPLSKVETDSDAWSYTELHPTPQLVGAVAYQAPFRDHTLILATT